MLNNFHFIFHTVIIKRRSFHYLLLCNDDDDNCTLGWYFTYVIIRHTVLLYKEQEITISGLELQHISSKIINEQIVLIYCLLKINIKEIPEQNKNFRENRNIDYKFN